MLFEAQLQKKQKKKLQILEYNQIISKTYGRYVYALPIRTTLKSPKQEYRIVGVLGHGGFGITYKVPIETEKR